MSWVWWIVEVDEVDGRVDELCEVDLRGSGRADGLFN